MPVTPIPISPVTLGTYVIRTAPIVAATDLILPVVAVAGLDALAILSGGLLIGAGAVYLFTPLGKHIDEFLKDTFFPTDAKEIPGVQTLMLYWGDSPLDGEPNKTNKINSGYASQLNALANMTVPEIKSFLTDNIAGKVAAFIDSAGVGFTDPLINGFSFDSSKLDDLSEELATKTKEWAEGKNAINLDKTIANGSGSKVDPVTGDVVIPEPPVDGTVDEDDKGRPLPGSLSELVGKPIINLCPDTMGLFRQIANGILAAYNLLYGGSLAGVVASIDNHAKNFNCEKENLLDDPLELRKTVAEVIRDKPIGFEILNENVYGGDG